MLGGRDRSLGSGTTAGVPPTAHPEREGRGKEQHPKVNKKFSENRRTLYTVATLEVEAHVEKNKLHFGVAGEDLLALLAVAGVEVAVQVVPRGTGNGVEREGCRGLCRGEEGVWLTE